MAAAWADLAGRIAAAAGEGPAPNVYEGLTSVVATPAVVIRPDEPWMENASGGGFKHRPERWVAVLAEGAGDPVAATHRLHAMALLVTEAASDAGWSWSSVSSITLDETTGAPLLVAVVRLTYQAPKS